MSHLVPIALFLSIAGVIIFIASRRNRERLELIRQGKNPYETGVPAPPKVGNKSLFLGILLFGFGLALLLAAILVQDFDRDMITAALIFCFSGISILLYWKLTAGDRERSRRMIEERYSLHIEEMRNKRETPNTAGDAGDDAVSA